MDYFVLKTSSELAAVGAVPQLHDFKSERPYDRNYSRLYKDFLSEALCMDDFKMQEEAKKTDLMSSAYLSLNGFFLSKRLEQVLRNYLVPHSKFYQGTYYHLGEPHPLAFLQLLDYDQLDFPESSFQLKGAEEKEVRAESLDALREWQSKLNRAPRRPRILPLRLKLNGCPDLLKVPLTGDFVVSQRLRETVANKELTGFRFRPVRGYEIISS